MSPVVAERRYALGVAGNLRGRYPLVFRVLCEVDSLFTSIPRGRYPMSPGCVIFEVDIPRAQLALA